MRFLVVDDEEDVRVLLRIYLESRGHTVVDAASPAAARDRCAEARADVLLLDVSLPGEDGTSVLRSLREAGVAPATVYLMSAVTPRVLVELARDHDAQPLPKPFTIATLAATLGADGEP